MVQQPCFGGFEQTTSWTGQETDQGSIDWAQKGTGDEEAGVDGVRVCTALPTRCPDGPHQRSPPTSYPTFQPWGTQTKSKMSAQWPVLALKVLRTLQPPHNFSCSLPATELVSKTSR